MPPYIDGLKSNHSHIQQHFIANLLIKTRPNGWYTGLFEHMNSLHVNSYYLGDIMSSILNEIKLGFLSDSELMDMKNLLKIVYAKREYAPKGKKKIISTNMIVNKINQLPIDKIITFSKKDKFQSDKSHHKAR